MSVPVLLLITAMAAPGSFYKWTDKHGHTHYGDYAPAQVPHERVETEEFSPPTTDRGSLPGLRPSEREMLEHIEIERQRTEKARKARAQREARRKRRQALETAHHQEKCDTYKRRLRRIENQLTSGYSADEAYGLHEKQDAYRIKIKTYCH
jgi:hypothetical protein